MNSLGKAKLNNPTKHKMVMPIKIFSLIQKSSSILEVSFNGITLQM